MFWWVHARTGSAYEVDVPLLFVPDGGTPGDAPPHATVARLKVRWMSSGGHVDPIVAAAFGNHPILNTIPQRRKLGLTVQTLASERSRYAGASLQLPAYLAMYAVCADKLRKTGSLASHLSGDRLYATGELRGDGAIEPVRGVDAKLACVVRGIDEGESAVFLVPAENASDIRGGEDVSEDGRSLQVVQGGSTVEVRPLRSLDEALEAAFGPGWTSHTLNRIRTRRRRWRVAAFIVPLLALIVSFPIWGEIMPIGPIDRVEGGKGAEVFALNRWQHTLWRGRLPGRCEGQECATLLTLRDGVRRVLVTTRGSAEAPSFVIMFDDSEQEIWRWSLSRGCVYRGSLKGHSPNLILPQRVLLEDLNGDGDDEIIVLANHNQSYPGRLSVLSLEGDHLATFWNCGHFARCGVCDLDADDGHQDLVCNVLNNRAFGIDAGLFPRHSETNTFHDGLLILRGRTILADDPPWIGQSPPFEPGANAPGRHDVYVLFDVDSSLLTVIPEEHSWLTCPGPAGLMRLGVVAFDGSAFRFVFDPELKNARQEPSSFSPLPADHMLIRIDRNGQVE